MAKSVVPSGRRSSSLREADTKWSSIIALKQLGGASHVWHLLAPSALPRLTGPGAGGFGSADEVTSPPGAAIRS